MRRTVHHIALLAALLVVPAATGTMFSAGVAAQEPACQLRAPYCQCRQCRHDRFWRRFRCTQAPDGRIAQTQAIILTDRPGIEARRIEQNLSLRSVIEQADEQKLSQSDGDRIEALEAKVDELIEQFEGLVDRVYGPPQCRPAPCPPAPCPPASTRSIE